MTAQQRQVFGAVMALVILLLSRSAATDRDLLAFRGPCASNPVDPGLQQRRAKDCSQRDTVLLGGLFPLHSWDSTTSSCNDEIRTNAFQSMEAVRFAIRQINAENIIPGVQLDFEMRDTCFSPELTRANTLRLINRGIGSGLYCNFSTALPVSGVIGAAASGNTIAAADLLGLFKVPQISYASTSATLSNKDRYRYFLRTIPPDNAQAEAIMAIINALEAKFFSLVHSTGNYGTEGAKEIRKAVSAAEKEETGVDRENICIAVDENVGNNTRGLPPAIYRDVLKKLFKNVGRKSSVVVVFTGVDAIRGFLTQAVSTNIQANLSDHHIWIAPDSWSNSPEVAHGALDVARGSLGVKPTTSVVDGFEQYFRALHPNNNTEPSFNPWLSEFWQKQFNCDPDSETEEERLSCRQNSLQDASYSFEQNAAVPYAIDAVYTFGHGIRLLQEERCGKGFRGICPAMLSKEKTRLGAIDGASLLPLLLKVNFNSSAGHKVAFTSNGDISTARYDITNLQVNPITKSPRYKYVGSWQRLVPGTHLGPSRRMADGLLTMIHCLPQDTPSQANCSPAQLNLNLSAIQWRNGSYGAQSMPRSRCSKLCQAGQYAKPLDNIPRKFGRCCWMCEQCTENYFTKSQFETCQRCPDRQHGNANQTGCVDLSKEHWSTDDAEAVVGVSLSVIGIVVAILIAVVSIWAKLFLPRSKHLDTQLHLQCLIGAVGLFVSVFMRILKPTVNGCLLHDVWLNASMAALVAPFLVQFVLIIWSDHHERTQKSVEGKYSIEQSVEHSSEDELKTVRQGDGRTTRQNTAKAIISVDYVGPCDRFFLACKSTVILTGILLTNVIISTATAISSDAKIDEKITANHRLTIACPLERTAIVGFVFAVCVAIAVILVRFYCQRRKIDVAAILTRVGYIMNVFLLLSSALLVVSSILSPKAKTATSVFLLLSIAYAFVVIVVTPDLLEALSTKENRRQLSEKFWVQPSKRGGVKRDVSSTEVKETIA